LVVTHGSPGETTARPRFARIGWILLLAGAAYFAVFAFPNATGAADTAMISIFEPDEFAQYTYLARMLGFDAGDLKQDIYHFVAYGHYYYGFPFYAASSIAVLPFRIANDLGNKNSEIPMLLLRQIVSVLPMLGAALLMTHAQTRFRSLVTSIVTMGLLLAMPAVVENDMWWHPDSLATFFIALTLYLLDRDQLDFGRNFLFAAVACGMATATKVLGLFFFLAIPTYIFLGIRRGSLGWKSAVQKAILFVAIMTAVIVAANPFLVIPGERNDMVRIISGQASAQSVGWVLQYAKGPASWWPILTRLYATPLFLVMALVVTVVLAARPGPRQVLNILILAWSAPLALYILFGVAIKPSHFFLPIMVPLASSIGGALDSWLPEEKRLDRGAMTRGLVKWLPGVVVLVLGLHQIAWSVRTDIPLYRDVLTREIHEPTVAFFNSLSRRYLRQVPEEQPLLVYRDVSMYFPQSRNRRVRVFFNTTNYDTIERMEPDLILFSMQRLLDYTTDSAAANAVAPDAFAEVQRLFADARNGEIKGYSLLKVEGAGMAFAKDSIYQQYLARP
jgi:hypothetical protein